MDPASIDRVEPAVHGGTDDPALLEFSANVNPRRPAGTAAVHRAALERARRYPDDDYPAFRTAAAAAVGCDPAAVVPTAGGADGLRLAFGALLDRGDRAAIPAPSFGEYEREVRLQGATPVHVPEDGVTEVDLEDLAMVVVCNPNNPTGRLYDAGALSGLRERCRAAGTSLLVDEAFLGFTEAPSMAGLDGPNGAEGSGDVGEVGDYDGDRDVDRDRDGDEEDGSVTDAGRFEGRIGSGGPTGTVVVRTLTKLYGLPGLRAGYLVAGGACGERLRRARRPWAVGTPASAVAVHCLRDRAFVEATRERVERERRRLRERLEPRFEVWPSAAPFLLLRPREESVDAVIETARRRGVAVRDARSFRGLDAHVRVAVRDRSSNDRLCQALGCGEARP